jgi:uncharacterized spore protein YtfJ
VAQRAWFIRSIRFSFSGDTRAIVVAETEMEPDPVTPSEPTRAEDVVLRLSEKLAITASARTVYGDPVHAHERTIIPVAKFGYGLGASSGGREGDKVGGGGGGGGVGAKPAGYIEITNQGTRYVDLSTPRRLLMAVAAGMAAGYLIARLRR